MAGREVKIAIIGDSRGLKRAFDKAERDAEGFGGKMRRTATRIGDAFRVIGPMVGAAFAAWGVYSIKTASDSAEAANVMGLAFGDAAKDIDKFAEDAASSMGMSKKAYREAAGGIGILLDSFGVADNEAAFMSAQLIQRAADIGSAFNASGQEVTDAMKSALTGESEPMKRFGVVLSEARIQAKALSMGLGDVSGTANLAGKAMAIQALIMEDSNTVAGDFANTLGESLPNQTKEAQAKFENLSEELGERLMPIALWALDQILTKLDEFQVWWDETGSQYFEDFKQGWRDLKTGAEEFFAILDGEGSSPVQTFFDDFAAHMEDAGWGVDEFERGLRDLKTGWGEFTERFPDGAQRIKDNVTSVRDSAMSTLLDVLIVARTVSEPLFTLINNALVAFKGLFDWVIGKLGAMQGAAQRLLDTLNPLSGGRSGSLPIGAGVSNVAGVLGFDTGGVVPGPKGSPRLVMAHGGETILPTHKDSMAGSSVEQINLVVDGRVLASVLRDQKRSLVGVGGSA